MLLAFFIIDKLADEVIDILDEEVNRSDTLDDISQY